MSGPVCGGVLGGPGAARGPRVTFCGAGIAAWTGDIDTGVAGRIARALDFLTAGVATRVAAGVAIPEGPAPDLATVTTVVTTVVALGLGGAFAAVKKRERSEDKHGGARGEAGRTDQLLSQLEPLPVVFVGSFDERRRSCEGSPQPLAEESSAKRSSRLELIIAR